jgi:hypothetical protein
LPYRADVLQPGESGLGGADNNKIGRQRFHDAGPKFARVYLVDVYVSPPQMQGRDDAGQAFTATVSVDD